METTRFDFNFQNEVEMQNTVIFANQLGYVLGFLAANLRLSKFVVVVRELEVVATSVDVD